MTDINSYIRSMSTTLYDKCWWIDKIPPEIDTVVDFGCAQGDLAAMIDRICPGHFSYIGIDNSPEMLERARQNHEERFPDMPALFFEDVTEAEGIFDPDHSILVMNSVMHEIFSYMDYENVVQLLMQLCILQRFQYIAFRDMHWTASMQEHTFAPDIFDKVRRSDKHSKWEQVVSRAWESSAFFLDPTQFALHEFLLKYRYDANWDREVNERYLWGWVSRLFDIVDRVGYDLLDLYEVELQNEFFIPFIRDRIRKDFGFDYPCNTHCKLLLRRREDEH